MTKSPSRAEIEALAEYIGKRIALTREALADEIAGLRAEASAVKVELAALRAEVAELRSAAPLRAVAGGKAA